MHTTTLGTHNNKQNALITKDMTTVLDKTALKHLSFTELAGTDSIWKINTQSYETIRAILAKQEARLRKLYPTEDLTCIISGKGVYWVDQAGFKEFIGPLNKTVTQLREQGPLPIQYCTTMELLACFTDNLRRLILASAHDSVLLDYLSIYLGPYNQFVSREFQTSRDRIYQFFSEFEEIAPNMECFYNQDSTLFERCRITRQMIEQGDITEKNLGYQLDQLKYAEEILLERCQKEVPLFQKRVESFFQHIQQCLRQSECSQLHRANRWEMTFSFTGNPPLSYRKYLLMAVVEQDGFSSMVTSREQEMGRTDFGKEALQDNQDLTQRIRTHMAEITKPGKAGQALTDEEIQQLIRPVVNEQAALASSHRKKSQDGFKRMAFHTKKNQ